MTKAKSACITDQDGLAMTVGFDGQGKVLGVAATSAQTPLNWPYSSWRNPYTRQASASSR